MQRLCLVVALFVSAVAVHEAKENPMAKILNLLEKMQRELRAEAKADEETIQKFNCWCTKNEAGKTQAISDGQDNVVKLQGKVESCSADDAKLGQELVGLKADLKEHTDALAAATELRKKQLAQFNEDEKDKLVTINSLKNAIVVLSKHQNEGLMQVANIMARYQDAVPAEHQSVVEAFVQSVKAKKDYFDSKNTFSDSYGSQSGPIFGILKNMLDTFEKELTQGQKDEVAAQAQFDELKATKEKLIADANSAIDEKSVAQGAAQQCAADSANDLANTKEQIEEDQAFLADMRMRCQKFTQESARRQEERTMEQEAVAQALKILREKEMTVGFVQLSSRKQKAPRMSLLEAQKGTFDGLFKRIDEIVEDTRQEKKDANKMYDSCVAQLNKNERELEETNHSLDNNKAAMNAAQEAANQLSREIEEAKYQVELDNESIAEAQKLRGETNEEFKLAIAEQQDMLQVLGRALDKLSAFYGVARSEGLEGTDMAEGASKSGGAPAAHGAYKANKSGNVVIDMIEKVVRDCQEQIGTLQNQEADDVTDTEREISDLKKNIANLSKLISGKEQEKAQQEADGQEASQAAASDSQTKNELTMTREELTKNCNEEFGENMADFESKIEGYDNKVEQLLRIKAILKKSAGATRAAGQ